MDDWRHEWEIDPATLEIGPKVGEGEFGTVHKVRAMWNLHADPTLTLDPNPNHPTPVLTSTLALSVTKA